MGPPYWSSPDRSGFQGYLYRNPLVKKGSQRLTLWSVVKDWSVLKFAKGPIWATLAEGVAAVTTTQLGKFTGKKMCGPTSLWGTSRRNPSPYGLTWLYRCARPSFVRVHMGHCRKVYNPYSSCRSAGICLAFFQSIKLPCVFLTCDQVMFDGNAFLVALSLVWKLVELEQEWISRYQLNEFFFFSFKYSL